MEEMIDWLLKWVKRLFMVLILILISIGMIFVITWVTPFISEQVYKLSGKTVVGTKDGWLGFYGGFLGGIIALVGIWFQMTRKEKQDNKDKFEGLKRYLSYVFRKNTEFENKEDIIYDIQSSINYLSEFEDVPYKGWDRYGELYLPKSKFIEDNLKSMMEFKEEGEELLDTIEEMNFFNQEIKFFNDSRIKNSGILYKIQNIINSRLTESSLKRRIFILIQIIREISRVVIYYNRMDSNKKDLEMLKSYQEEIMENYFKKYNKYCDGLLYWIDLSKLEKEFLNLKLEERNIETSVKLNRILIELVKRLSSYLKIKFEDNKELEEELFNLSKELIKSTMLDTRINGRYFLILERINKSYEILKNLNY